MSLFKSKAILTLLVLFFTSSAFSAFDEMQCLNSSFSTSVSHKGKPFGLTQNVIKIGKENCVITIEHEKLKFMKKKFVIDVCRAPVHIKAGVGAVEVLKREGECDKKAKGEFCKELRFIEDIIQDDGLIFAKGEKEDIETDHGRIYCSYLLLKAYLESGRVLSRHNGGFRMQGIPLIAPSELKKNPSDGMAESTKADEEAAPVAPAVEATPQSTSNQGADF
jgi:hypothetical protein